MQLYSDSIDTTRGAPLRGATVTIYDEAGDLATIYDADGVEQANPLTTDSTGSFSFRAANGEYTATIEKVGIETKSTTFQLYDPADDPASAENLASTSDGKGAGLVGFSALASYAAGTAGKQLQDLGDVVVTGEFSKGYFGALSYDENNDHIPDSGGVYVGGEDGLLIRHEGYEGDEGSLAIYPQTANRAGRISLCPSGDPANMNGEDTSSFALQRLNGASEERLVLVSKKVGEYRIASYKHGSGSHYPITIHNGDEKLIEFSTGKEVIVTRGDSGNTGLAIQNTGAGGKRWYLLSKTDGVFELYLNGVGTALAVDDASRNVSLGGAVGSEALRAAVVASAVNRVEVTGAVTGGAPALSFTGSDPDVNGVYWAKGAGRHAFGTGATYTEQLRIPHTAGATNYATITGANADAPTFSVAGSSTDISMLFTTKGAGNFVYTGGSIAVFTAGRGFRVKEGANCKQGIATLVGGTVTVATTVVTASSRILLTVQSLGTVTIPKAVAVTARVAGTSFTITSEDATDTSVVAYQIFEPA